MFLNYKDTMLWPVEIREHTDKLNIWNSLYAQNKQFIYAKVNSTNNALYK